MATSLVSLISGRKVKPQVGMTGEITLRGQVLAIGGVKEKVLAAHRNGLTTIILPKRNEQDLDDVPEEIRSSMKFIFAESVEDVIDAALEKAKSAKKQPARKALAKKQPLKPVTKKSTKTKAKKNDKDKGTARRR
jgi:ATP-dependent Lon protease